MPYDFLGDGWKRWDFPSRSVITRAVHQCQWCCVQIDVGQAVFEHRWLVIADGERHFSRMYFHKVCEQEMETFIAEEEEHIQDAIQSARRP